MRSLTACDNLKLKGESIQRDAGCGALAVRAYFHMGLDLLDMYETETEDVTVTLMADVVALIDQGADVNTTDSDGWAPLLSLVRRVMRRWPWPC